MYGKVEGISRVTVNVKTNCKELKRTELSQDYFQWQPLIIVILKLQVLLTAVANPGIFFQGGFNKFS